MSTITFKKPALIKRFMAFIIDMAILNLILIPFDGYFEQYIASDVSTYVMKDLVDIYFFEILVGVLFYFLIIVLYFSIFEYLIGKTPGKGFWRMRVVQMRGKKSYGYFLVRSLQVFFLVPFWIIDVPFMFSRKRDRLLERISRTTVIIG